MAKITPLYANANTEQSTTETSAQDAITLQLSTNTTYFVFLRADAKADSAVVSVGFDFDTGAAVTFYEFTGNDLREVSFCTRVQVGSSSRTMKIQYKSSDGTTVRIAGARIMAVPLNQLTEGTHYLYLNNAATNPSLSSHTSYSKMSEQTVSVSNNGDTWIVFAPALTIAGNIDWRLNKNSDSVVSPAMGTDIGNNNRQQSLLAYVFTFNDSDTIDVEAKKRDASGTDTGIAESVYALNLSEFNQSYSANVAQADATAEQDEVIDSSTSFAGEASGTTNFVLFTNGLHEGIDANESGFYFGDTGDNLTIPSDGLSSGVEDSYNIPVFNFSVIEITDDATSYTAELRSFGMTQWDEDPDPSTEDLQYPYTLPSWCLFEAEGDNISSSPSPSFGVSSRHIQMAGGQIVMQGGMIL